MKKIILFSLAFVLFPIVALCENWVNVTGDVYVDVDSISCVENICRTWTRLTPSIEGKSGVIGFEMYDCKEFKSKLLQMTEYDKSGRVVFEVKRGDIWKDILPDTIEEKKSRIVCKKKEVK